MKGHENINLGYIHDNNNPVISEKPRGYDLEDTQKPVQIQRNLGLWSGVSIIVGTIIGSGIWVTPGSIMQYSESVGIFLVQWVVCGLLSALGAMCYIELACVVPQSGGETVYLKAAFGDFVSFVFSWLRAIVLGPTSCAFLAGVSSEYILRVHPDIETTLNESIGFEWTKKIVGVGLLLISSLVNILSSRGAAIVQNIVTVSKMVGVVIVIIGGFVRLGQGNTESFQSGFDRLCFLDKLGPASIGLIAFNGLWNYDGWNQLNFVAEELEDPGKNFPRCILLSMPLVVLVYILMNISYLSAMSPQELFESSAVGVQWAEVVLHDWSWIIPVFVFISSFGTMHASLFASGRQVYAASREGHLPEVISYVNKFTLTPLPGLLFNGAFAVMFLLMRDINALLDMYMVAASFFYGLCMLALIVLRFTKKDAERTFKIWIVVPVAILIFFWYCTIAPLTELPSDIEPSCNLTTTTAVTSTIPSNGNQSMSSDDIEEKASDGPVVGNIDMYKWNGICLVPGLILYLLRLLWRWYWNHKYGIHNKPMPGSGIFTKIVQKLLCVVEEDDHED